MGHNLSGVTRNIALQVLVPWSFLSSRFLIVAASETTECLLMTMAVTLQDLELGLEVPQIHIYIHSICMICPQRNMAIEKRDKHFWG